MTLATTYDPANRDLTQAAKFINRAMHDLKEQGETTWAERLSIAIDLLSAPNFREPVLPSLPKRIHQK